MKKFKKIIALGLATMATVSAIGVNAMAEELNFNDGTVEGFVQKDYTKKLNFTDGTIELQPGESIGNEDFDDDSIWLMRAGTTHIDDDVYQGSDGYERSFTCYATQGTRLNIYVKNNGPVPVNVTLKTTTSENAEDIYLYSYKDITKRFTNDNGITGKWTIIAENYNLDGDPIDILVRAKQY